MSARPIGEITAPLFAHAERMRGFQEVLRKCRTDAGRKELIIAAYMHGGLTLEDAQLLYDAEMLEEA